MKICDEHNGQINLRTKQKYDVLSIKGPQINERGPCKTQIELREAELK